MLLQNQILIRNRRNLSRQKVEVIAMSKQIIDDYLDELDDLVQECKDLTEEDDIAGAKNGITDNMIRIKSIADEVLDLV